jgi:hypothetical protein
MRKRLTYLGVLSGLLLALLALIPGTAYADPGIGNGATVVTERYCQPSGPFTFCVDANSEFNNVGTPSGNFMFEMNQHFTATFAAPGLSETDTQRNHVHQLVTSGTVQELQNRNQFTFAFTAGGSTLTCTASDTFHEANGQIQYVRFTPFTCTITP